MTRRIDPEQWARRDHYRWFRSLEYPYVGVTAEVDATDLEADCKEAGFSLFAGFLHRLLAAANAVPELRMRIRVEQGRELVVEHERVDAGITLPVGDGLFTFASVPFTSGVRQFATELAARRARLGDNPPLEPFEKDRDDLVFCTCLPWIRFTQVTHPMTTARTDSVPRIAWGRIEAQGSRRTCPVNIQAHHALVDGVHIGRFFEELERGLR